MKNHTGIVIAFLVISLAVCCTAQKASAESASLYWSANYNRGLETADFATGLIVDEQDDILLAGKSDNICFLLKLDPFANHIWTAYIYTFVIDCNFQDAAYKQGTGYVIGAGNEFTTALFDSNGASIWDNRFKPPDRQAGTSYSVNFDSNGNAFSAGVVNDDQSPGFSNDVAVVKYDPNGALLWSYLYDGDEQLNDYVVDSAITSSDDIVVAGFTETETNVFNALILKISADGALVWEATFDGPDSLSDAAAAIAIDNSGNVTVAGYSDSASTGSDIWVARYDADGTRIWSMTYDGAASAFDSARALKLDEEGNTYVAGQSVGIADQMDAVTLKIDPDGLLIWDVAFDSGSGYSDIAYDVLIDQNGDNLTLSADFVQGAGVDTFVIKRDGDGNNIWTARYYSEREGTDVGVKIAMDSTGAPIVAGYSIGEDTDWNFMGLKFTQCADCSIGGRCFENGQIKPNDDCLVCDISQHETKWTALDGSPCDDGDFCNGEDFCDQGKCTAHDSPPECADDGLYCSGEEYCDSDANACVSTGDPCPEGLACDEATQLCFSPEPENDDDDIADDDDDEDTSSPTPSPNDVEAKNDAACCG